MIDHRAPVLLARRLDGAPPGVAEAVFRDLSLELEPGTWLAVTGPNGSGKTTLALTLAGLWGARAGTIELGARRGSAARVVTILQEPATQITQRTVLDEIAFTALNLGAGADTARRAAETWASRLGVEPLLGRVPHELSAGEQQRVLLAQALAVKPDLLIADEATAHLDPDGRRVAFEWLRSEIGAGLAVLWITQEQEELERADRVLRIAPPEGRGAGRAAGEEGAAGFATAGTLEAEAPLEAFEVPGEDGPVGARVALRVAPAGGAHARVRASRPIEVEIGPRGVWAAVGPNGSGKSSLLECLAGLENLPEAQVRWIERPQAPPILVGQYPERQIFEERVGAELLFAATQRGRDRLRARAAALRLCAAMGFDERFLERRTWSLSAGEKRLASLIGALIAPASLVLFDEPTCGIDHERRALLARWIRELGRRVPVVVASQDAAWVGEMGASEIVLGAPRSARS